MTPIMVDRLAMSDTATQGTHYKARRPYERDVDELTSAFVRLAQSDRYRTIANGGSSPCVWKQQKF